MIEVAMSNQNRVNVWPNMIECARNNRRVRPNRLLKRHIGKARAREVRINKKRMAIGFELVTVDSEICHSDRADVGTAARLCGVGVNERRVASQPRAHNLWNA